ncbi:hypothetical protein IEQ34_001968 [Dendrobium chrysotoxum]|uniref:sphingosine kinase n=1 Tax=Dendrobium chrysotoxum TaxID=161865 RepID=A0AAV7HIB9_DENCH|nr:hypothetical protein IEQ34_001968 [Dendrobium chrysotoxum]
MIRQKLGRPKRIFIILNPYGGKKSARKIFHSEIRPLLLAANIIYTLQETQYQLHAQELAYKLDFLNYDGIVCVSGDGVLVEVVNGLLQREDWDTAIKVPLGIIPAGTGNGLAKSILDAVGENYSIQNATFAVIRGHKRALDVTTVLQGKTKFFSILMLSWGLIADIDIESEKYRWMGDTRLDFYVRLVCFSVNFGSIPAYPPFGGNVGSWAFPPRYKSVYDQGDGLISNISVDQCILRVMKLRKYHGNIEYVPAPGHESFGKPKSEREAIAGNIEISKLGRDGDADVLHGYQGPNCCFEDSVWRFLEGPFISIMLVNVPWVGKDAMPAPEAKFSDGFLDLVLIKDCPKSALASLLLKTGNGSHVKSPYVMYLKVKAFRLVPGNRVGDSAKGGIVDVDGEVVARGEGVYMCGQERDPMSYGPPILLTVDKGLATVFSSR